ncbi:MAG TPA: hypothetical protein VLQ46_12935, partial [Casimicrobiaceae bacterium]|nr:hypothetical protein [Casimicrobiaceae bacterium]
GTIRDDTSEASGISASTAKATRLRAIFANVTIATLHGAGHMIHHERPEETAELLTRFLE